MPPDALAAPAAALPERTRTSAVAQYLKFCAVGLTNAVIDLGVLNGLLLLRPTDSTIDLLAYNTVAVCLAILNSYIWNTRWTFRGQAVHTRREWALFVAQALLNIATNDLVLAGLTGLLAPSDGFSELLVNNAAKLGAMVAASTLSFLLLRGVVFRPGGTDRRQAP
jgi:putative flippase GtrA